MFFSDIYCENNNFWSLWRKAFCKLIDFCGGFHRRTANKSRLFLQFFCWFYNIHNTQSSAHSESSFGYYRSFRARVFDKFLRFIFMTSSFIASWNLKTLIPEVSDHFKELLFLFLQDSKLQFVVYWRSKALKCLQY